MKLTGFCSADQCYGPKSLRGIVGEEAYMAPEMINKDDYGFKVDVWSATVVAYELLAGKTPF